jgi:hypothetical protein
MCRSFRWCGPRVEGRESTEADGVVHDREWNRDWILVRWDVLPISMQDSGS